MAARGGVRILAGLALSTLLLAPVGCGGVGDSTTSLIQPPSGPPAAPAGPAPAGARVVARSGGTVDASATFTPSLPLSGYNALAFQHLTLDAISGGGQVLGLAYWTGSTYQFGNLTVPEINALGTTRGYWLYTSGPTSFTYSGNDLSGNRNVPLGFGWNMVGFPAQQDVQASTLQTSGPNGPVNMTSVIATDFYEVNTNNQNVPVNVLLPGATLRAGRPYWVYAATPVTLSFSVPVQPSPSPSVVPVTSPSPSPVASPSPSPVTSPTPPVTVGGQLQFLRTTALTGTGPNFPALNPDNRFLYVPYFNSNSVGAYSVDSSSGALTEVAGSPFASSGQPGAATMHPLGSHVYISNAASSSINVFAINNSTGALTLQSTVAAGSNPLEGAVAVTSGGFYLYVANFNGASVSRYRIETSGNLTALGTTSTATNVLGNDELIISPDNLNLYTSSGTGFSINPSTGDLTPVPGSPVAGLSSTLAITPDGKFVYAFQESISNGSLLTFSRNASTGALTQVSTLASAAPNTTVAQMSMAPNGRVLYLPSNTDNTIRAFSLDTSTGAATPLTGSPFASGAPNAQPTFLVLNHLATLGFGFNRGTNNVCSYSLTQ